MLIWGISYYSASVAVTAVALEALSIGEAPEVEDAGESRSSAEESLEDLTIVTISSDDDDESPINGSAAEEEDIGEGEELAAGGSDPAEFKLGADQGTTSAATSFLDIVEELRRRELVPPNFEFRECDSHRFSLQSFAQLRDSLEQVGIDLARPHSQTAPSEIARLVHQLNKILDRLAGLQNEMYAVQEELMLAQWDENMVMESFFEDVKHLLDETAQLGDESDE